jgi:ubiquinone biosynthesis protein Coq4
MAELAGCANRKQLARAIAWALANKPLIQAEWDKLNGD